MRRLAAALVLALASSAIACGSDSVTNPTPESLAGTWNLSTLNGVALPFVLQQSNPKVELLSDQIVVSSDGTFTDTFSLRFTDAAGVVTNDGGFDTGTWTLNGAALVLRYDSDASVSTASVAGNSFTISVPGLAQLYTKQ
jgi:hypothetical protein